MRIQSYLFALAFILLGCEPDDICLAETPGTPQLIVVFYDKVQSEDKKQVSNLQITGLGSETTLFNGTTDSIAIPLKVKENSTTFIFTKTANDVSLEETITFNYDSNDHFISRACGYQKIFTNVTSERLNRVVWIESIEIINNSISDTKHTHVKILH